jgi:hypothetical protein
VKAAVQNLVEMGAARRQRRRRAAGALLPAHLLVPGLPAVTCPLVGLPRRAVAAAGWRHHRHKPQRAGCCTAWTIVGNGEDAHKRLAGRQAQVGGRRRAAAARNNAQHAAAAASGTAMLILSPVTETGKHAMQLQRCEHSSSGGGRGGASGRPSGKAAHPPRAECSCPHLSNTHACGVILPCRQACLAAPNFHLAVSRSL